jgi:hypothetical protein
MELIIPTRSKGHTKPIKVRITSQEHDKLAEIALSKNISLHKLARAIFLAYITEHDNIIKEAHMKLKKETEQKFNPWGEPI